MHSVFLDAVTPYQLKKCQAKQFMSSFFLSTWAAKPDTRFDLEKTTHCTFLCSHLFGRVFKKTTHRMLNTRQTSKCSISLSCGFSLFLFFYLSPNTKCDDFSMWWLCWIGGLFVCSTHPLHSSNLVCIHSVILRPKDRNFQTGNLSTAAAPSCGATAFPAAQVCPLWVQLVLVMPNMTLPEFAFSINPMPSLMWTWCFSGDPQYNKGGIKTTLIIRKLQYPKPDGNSEYCPLFIKWVQTSAY